MTKQNLKVTAKRQSFRKPKLVLVGTTVTLVRGSLMGTRRDHCGHHRHS